jgi:hypothetical protein
MRTVRAHLRAWKILTTSALLLAVGVTPAHADTGTGCGTEGISGTVAGINCGTISITHNGGACYTTNAGTTNVTQTCSAATFYATVDAFNWQDSGSYWASIQDPGSPTSCTFPVPPTTEASWTGPVAPPAASPYLVMICPGFTKHWGDCWGQSAYIRVEWSGGLVFGKPNIDGNSEWDGYGWGCI